MSTSKYKRTLNQISSMIQSLKECEEEVNMKKGFTLIELLVIIAIIGILSTIAVDKMLSPVGKNTDEYVNVPNEGMEIKIIEITKENLNFEILKIREKSYLVGQKDALNGKIRIKEFNGKFVFVVSPWDTHDTVYSKELDFRAPEVDYETTY